MMPEPRRREPGAGARALRLSGPSRGRRGLLGPRGLAGLLGLLCAAGCPADPAATLSVRLENLAVWRMRLEWAAPEFRLVCSQRRETGRRAAAVPPARWGLGLSCPWLVGGNVRTTGLLRQLSDPLGFAAGSGVYREDCGLALDTSIDPVARLGAEMRLAAGRLRLLAVREGGSAREVQPQAGAVLTLSAGQGSRLELLGLLSRPAAGGGGEQWFPLQAPYPGGLLGHGAAQMHAQAGGLQLRCSGAVSGGQRVRPGAWGSLGCAWVGRLLQGQLQVSACSADYRAPGGEAGTERGLAAAVLSARVGPGAELQLSACRRLDAASEAGPVLAGLRRWRCTDSVQLQLLARFGSAGARAAGRRGPAARALPRLRLELCGERQAALEGPARYVGQCRAVLESRRGRAGPGQGGASSSTSHLRAELHASVSGIRPAEGAWNTALSVRWRHEGASSLSLECQLRLKEHGALAAELVACLQRNGARLYARLGSRDVAGTWRALRGLAERGRAAGRSHGCSLTVGWEARSPGRRGKDKSSGAREPQPSASSSLAVWK